VKYSVGTSVVFKQFFLVDERISEYDEVQFGGWLRGGGSALGVIPVRALNDSREGRKGKNSGVWSSAIGSSSHSSSHSSLTSSVEGKTEKYAAVFPMVKRVIAIGDIHGDIDAFRSVLRNAGLISPNDEWSGGSSVLVQVGDQLDRGDNEREILDLLFRLQGEAKENGGAVHVLLGNHEVMNVDSDFRYVTPRGFEDFSTVLPKDSINRELRKVAGSNSAWADMIKNMPDWMRPRALAFRPGGPISSNLFTRAQVAVVVGDNVFVHGGLKPEHLPDGLDSIDKLNDECHGFLRGKREKPIVLRGGKGPLWMRNYSRPIPTEADCQMLFRTLERLNAKRMIVGHSVQKQGINSACGGRVWRVDTGMSSAYGGTPEALEITPSRIRILTPKGPRSASTRVTRH